MPVLLACAIEDSTDIFGISGGGGWKPQTHRDTPLPQGPVEAFARDDQVY